MITPYTSQQPVDDYGLRFADLKYSATLAAASEVSFTVPGVAPSYKAVMKCENDAVVWVALNATAAVPAGASFAATTSEMITVNNELCREVKAGDILHFISASTPDVSVVFYAIGTNN